MAAALHNIPIKRISLSNLMVPSSPPKERSSSFSSGSMPSLSSLTSLASSTRSYDEESNIHEQIIVTVIFPTGENREIKVSTGQTVQDLKKTLEVKHQVPCKASSLFYDGVFMLDPLSINDFPKIIRDKGATLTLKISNEENCNTNIPINNGNESADEKNSMRINGSGNNSTPNGNRAEKRTKKSVVETSSSDSEGEAPWYDGNEEFVGTPPKLRSIPSIDITHGIPVHSISPPPHIHNQVFSDATDITPQNTSPPSHSTPLIGSPTLESYSNLNSVNLSPIANSVLRAPTPTPGSSRLSSYSSSSTSSLTVAVSDHAIPLDSSRSLPDTHRTSGISVNFSDTPSTPQQQQQHPNTNTNTHNPQTSIDIKHTDDEEDFPNIPNIQTLEGNKKWRICWLI